MEALKLCCVIQREQASADWWTNCSASFKWNKVLQIHEKIAVRHSKETRFCRLMNKLQCVSQREQGSADSWKNCSASFKGNYVLQTHEYSMKTLEVKSVWGVILPVAIFLIEIGVCSRVVNLIKGVMCFEYAANTFNMDSCDNCCYCGQVLFFVVYKQLWIDIYW